MKKTTSDQQIAGMGQEGRMIFLGQKVWEELRILARLAKGALVVEQQRSTAFAVVPVPTARRRKLA